jgi:tetratricopeptide (TPR) repeat protein
VELGRRARSAAEEADDRLFSCLHHLGLALAHRGRLTRNAGDLDEAIAVHHEAIAVGTEQATEPEGLATAFQGLAVELLQRYQAKQVMRDLDAAIEVGRQGVARATEAEPGSLHNLCYMLTLRSRAIRSATDLSDAIRVGEEAVAAAPVGHPERPAVLNSLSIAWQFRDLDTAITFAREAVAASPDRDTYDVRKATRMANLAQMLAARFHAGGRSEDIDEAIDLLDRSLELTPRNHPKRAELLPQLAVHLSQRFKADRRLEDMRRIIDIQQNLTNNPPSEGPRA